MHHDLILHPTIGSPDRALNGIFLQFLYLNIQLQQIILNFCFCKWLFSRSHYFCWLLVRPETILVADTVNFYER